MAQRKARAPDDVLPHLRRARDHADRNFAEPLDLAQLASVAALSPWYFQRLFTATYGVSPAQHISRRRVERAQDLLRTSNLTVTEVCFLVGFSSLGSFSSRFRALVGETPRAYQRRWAQRGAPKIPGCWVFMWGLSDSARVQDAPLRSAGAAATSAKDSASQEKPHGPNAP